jgi:hypothetical protein
MLLLDLGEAGMSDLASLEDYSGVHHAFESALAAPLDCVRASAVIEISNQVDWIDTGIEVAAGEQFSLFAAGVAWIARPLDLGLEARIVIWWRIEGGPICRMADNTSTFTAERAGRLQVINGFVGQWLDEAGRFDPAYPLAPNEGAFLVAVTVWRGPATDGLARLETKDSSGLVAKERTRLAEERPVPRGWKPLWRLGRTSIFCDAVEPDGSPIIACRCTRDGGILVRPIDSPLDETTRLAWRWRVSTMPSRVAEDTLPTHDYLSIAVEFDNGQDLTYIWSSALPVEHSFRCPLPWWDARETHLVVRSGEDGLGRWTDEERAILADYQAAIGGEPPRRIVAIWLIAASVFQRQAGACDFAAITLSGGHGQAEIHA